ncbi:MAG TPA: glycoside hydrolase family 3 N-terminal domain-containing protein [Microlunatus sp.]
MTEHLLDALWRDPSCPADERVEALLADMTLAEKVAQLGSVWLGFDVASGDVAPMQNVFSRATSFAEATAHGLGQLTRVFGTAPVTAAEGVARVHELQRTLMSSTRLGIPAVVHEECLTGFTTYQATIYPGSLAWAATFDPALVHEMASAIGRDMAAVGVHQGLSPVLDVVRDYRWGRVEETLGEDPYLVSQVGSAYVRGLEENGIIATLKHFAGYAASQAARNHAPVRMGPREFAEVILPPFEHAVRYAGVRSVMNSYTDVDGIPVASDEALLTGVLREQWGFTGTVVSDYGAVAFLQIMHRIAATEGEAAAYALAAGLDVELPSTLCYGRPLLDEIAAGRVDEALVDRSVRRVLAQKIQLGLLDPDWSPEANAAAIELDPAANRDIARRLAEESVVLLDNPSRVLPLAGDRERRVAVVGPCADDPLAFFGCYAFPNHVIPQHPEFAAGIGIEADSLLTALRSDLPAAEISYLPGCEVSGGDDAGITAAVDAASSADLVLLAVGDRAGLFGGGTSGEGCDAEDLALPGLQPQLVEAVLATGTPVVMIMVSGRPYAIGPYRDRLAATVQAFFPGEEGGGAIAGVLSGRVNPTGKLPVGVPHHVGGSPFTYLAPPLGQHSQGVSNLDPSPAYWFGHGLSYTTYAYADLAASSGEIDIDGSVELRVTVTNTGSRDGVEVVQLYAGDPVSSVTRPVTQLVGFARVPLAAGASSTVTFEVHTDRLSFTGRDLTRIVEPGEIVFRVGTAGDTFAGPVTIRLVGETRTLTGRRVMDTATRLS